MPVWAWLITAVFFVASVASWMKMGKMSRRHRRQLCLAFGLLFFFGGIGLFVLKGQWGSKTNEWNTFSVLVCALGVMYFCWAAPRWNPKGLRWEWQRTKQDIRGLLRKKK